MFPLANGELLDKRIFITGEEAFEFWMEKVREQGEKAYFFYQERFGRGIPKSPRCGIFKIQELEYKLFYGKGIKEKNMLEKEIKKIEQEGRLDVSVEEWDVFVKNIGERAREKAHKKARIARDLILRQKKKESLAEDEARLDREIAEERKVEEERNNRVRAEVTKEEMERVEAEDRCLADEKKKKNDEKKKNHAKEMFEMKNLHETIWEIDE